MTTNPSDFRNMPVTQENVIQWVASFPGESIFMAITDFGCHAYQLAPVFDLLHAQKLVSVRCERGCIRYYPAEHIEPPADDYPNDCYGETKAVQS